MPEPYPGLRIAKVFEQFAANVETVEEAVMIFKGIAKALEDKEHEHDWIKLGVYGACSCGAYKYES